MKEVKKMRHIYTICILRSCDRDLEQAVRFLPGQKRRLCIPYCLFIFLCNMAADVVFL